MGKPEIELPAYAQTIGVELDGWEENSPILAIDYANELCGNPGMFHGGAVGALLEMAAVATLDAELRQRQGAAILTPINSTVEFLRAAGEARTFASATIIRAGRRLANVQATLWQESPEKPVATCVVNIAIAPGES
jgi:uncharacterized protein (TIGR00369 family)